MKNEEDFETKLSPSARRFLKAGNMFTAKSPPTGKKKSTWLFSFEILWIEMSNNNMKMDQYNKSVPCEAMINGLLMCLGWSPGDNSSKFDESWPTSERPSTVE